MERDFRLDDTVAACTLAVATTVHAMYACTCMFEIKEGEQDNEENGK